MKPRPKHVIFLGAGASFTSGYPIGQQLRLLMSSKDYLKEKLVELYPATYQSPDPIQKNIQKCLDYFDKFSDSIELFRRGDFATVDEFSKLASSSYPAHVQAMKKLMSFIFALHNPERTFHKSDYYPFVQKLFQADVLNQFRSEITVITFNYDCYLDYVMRQAFYGRLKLSKFPIENTDFAEQWNSKLSSGFSVQGPDNPQAFKQTELAWNQTGFNYFKLHGSMTYGDVPVNFGYDKLFRNGAVERFNFLNDDWFINSYLPPIVFPWELFESESRTFIPEDNFIFVKEEDGNKKREGKRLFNHFTKMWENAKFCVEQADKISFVGLSMHEYLKTGFGYLFQDIGKTSGPRVVVVRSGQTVQESRLKRVETVVANIENQNQFSTNRLHPASLCGKVSQLLMEVAPNMRYIRSSSEFDGILSTDSVDRADDPDITPRLDFKQFIEREMD